MLAFCHLCIGSILGVHLSRLTRFRGTVPLAAFGSILPDLVDKPLGFLVYGDILGHGRLYLHTLLFLLVISILGILVMRLRGSCAAALVAGLFGLHQLMDLMWLAPSTWFYPFLGAFPTEAPVSPAGWVIALEAGSVSEWVFVGVLALILLSAWKGDRVLSWGALALLLLGVAAVGWLLRLPLHLLPDEMMETGPMLLLVSLAGSLGLWLTTRPGGRDRLHGRDLFR